MKNLTRIATALAALALATPALPCGLMQQTTSAEAKTDKPATAKASEPSKKAATSQQVAQKPAPETKKAVAKN